MRLLLFSALAFAMLALTPAEREMISRLEGLRVMERAELENAKSAAIRAQVESARNEGRLEKAEAEVTKIESERDGWRKNAEAEKEARVKAEKKVLEQRLHITWLYGAIVLLIVSFGVCVWLRIKGVL